MKKLKQILAIAMYQLKRRLIMKRTFALMISIVISITFIPAVSFANTNENELNSIEALVNVEKANGETLEVQELDNADYDGFIFELNDDVNNKEIRKMEKAADSLSDDNKISEIKKGEIYSADSLETIERVADVENIEIIEPNYINHVTDYSSTPNDPYYSNQKWALDAMNVQTVWKKGQFGKSDITVAVIDTGVNAKHPDLTNIVLGKSFVKGVEGTSSEDIDFHGTFVAGIIGANNNNGVGITGNMPRLKIYPIRVFYKYQTNAGTYECSARNDDVIKAVKNATENNVDVINMSLGSYYYSEIFQNAINAANKKGIIVVAAAGNDASKNKMYPAGYNNVIGVGAIDKNLRKADYSNYNKSVDVVAPGSGIYSTVPVSYKSTGYFCGDGTSFACPQIAALAGMVKSIDNSVNHDRFLAAIQGTSTDLGTSGYDNEYGWGLANYSAMNNRFTKNTQSFVIEDAATVYVQGSKAIRVIGAKDSVKWTSSDTSIATVSSSGVVKAKKKGTCTVTATSGNMESHCEVNVIEPQISKGEIKVGWTKKTTLSVVGGSGKTSWKTSNNAIATVSSKGVVVGKKKGTCTVTAKRNGVTMKCKVKVVQELSESNIIVEYHRMKYINIIGGNGKATWTSSKKKVAFAGDFDGKNKTGAMISGANVGTCTINVKMNGKTMKCKVTVPNYYIKNKNVYNYAAINKLNDGFTDCDEELYEYEYNNFDYLYYVNYIKEHGYSYLREGKHNYSWYKNITTDEYYYNDTSDTKVRIVVAEEKKPKIIIVFDEEQTHY